ncbi:MAG: hypothetical protein LBU72_03740 [Burkholderiaceae bacterium]|nr:hypothetical protein [Burkholderiaceae bacterium]
MELERLERVAHQQGALARVGQGALNAQLVVAGQFDVFVLLDQTDDFQRVDGRVGAEGDVDRFGRGIDFLYVDRSFE